MTGTARLMSKKIGAFFVALFIAAGLGVTALPTPAVAAGSGPTVPGEWVCNSSGDCQYHDSETGFFDSLWVFSGGKWYYIKSDGWMARAKDNVLAIEPIDGHYYAFDSTGAMVTGWYHWLNEESGNYDWLYFAPDGKWLHLGWHVIDGKRYYFFLFLITDYMDGAEIDGKTYRILPSGAAFTGWYQDGADWYYHGSDGAMYKEQWLQYNGKWYYFDAAGLMVSGTEKYLGDATYYFDASGAMVTGWALAPFTYCDPDEWYYFGTDGAMYQGKWLYQNGKWYYFMPTYMPGMMIADDCYPDDSGNLYCFDKTGAMMSNRWYQWAGTGWVYLGSSGAAHSGWLLLNGKWYYLDPLNYEIMVHSQTKRIDNAYYEFDSSGAWTGRMFAAGQGAQM